MGGHAAGEVASRLAVEAVLGSWATARPGPANQALRGATRAANAAVFAASFDHEHQGMGTTLTALVLTGNEAHVAHIGDSRAYLVRKRQCTQLTSDHSRVAEMLRMRLITPEQAAVHPARSQLTRSLGSAPAVRIDLGRSQVETGDAFVLCSDGLWDLVSKKEIVSATSTGTATDAAEGLVRMALERGAPDNITVVVVCVKDGLPASSSDHRPKSRLDLFRRSRRLKTEGTS
jgi:protein phosphatase